MHAEQRHRYRLKADDLLRFSKCGAVLEADVALTVSSTRFWARLTSVAHVIHDDRVRG